jgi:hypothetical protein
LVQGGYWRTRRMLAMESRAPLEWLREVLPN